MNLIARICLRNTVDNALSAVQQWFKDKAWHLKWTFREWQERRAAVKAAHAQGFQLPTVRHMAPIPAGDNPFHHDASHMGSMLVRGWVVMHSGFDSKNNPLDLNYVILINTRTGQRIHVGLKGRS